MTTASAQSHPNIALIKYWGNLDENLRLPANGSISMNLDGLYTRTQVTFDADFKDDSLELNGAETFGPALERVSVFLGHVRRLSGRDEKARVVSENNFPIGTGIASSASAFASLALAASRAAGLELDERRLSRLAQLGLRFGQPVRTGRVCGMAGRPDGRRVVRYFHRRARPLAFSRLRCHRQSGA